MSPKSRVSLAESSSQRLSKQEKDLMCSCGFEDFGE